MVLRVLPREKGPLGSVPLTASLVWTFGTVACHPLAWWHMRRPVCCPSASSEHGSLMPSSSRAAPSTCALTEFQFGVKPVMLALLLPACGGCPTAIPGMLVDTGSSSPRLLRLSCGGCHSLSAGPPQVIAAV